MVVLGKSRTPELQDETTQLTKMVISYVIPVSSKLKSRILTDNFQDNGSIRKVLNTRATR